MAGTGEVRVKGLRELNRAFKNADADLRREFKKTLMEVAEPVRVRAEALAVSEIRNIGSEWSQMRIGATARTVYVAPKQRGNKMGPQKRPNLGVRLIEDAMEPALEENTELIVARLERMLDMVGITNGF